MAVRAETFSTREEISKRTGLHYDSFEVGHYISDEKGRLEFGSRLPPKRGIYIQNFLISGLLVPFYLGRSYAKEGVKTRINSEYLKSQNQNYKPPRTSGPLRACLELEYHVPGGLPIIVLFHDMSGKTDDEIIQTEHTILRMNDFCANTQHNNGVRMDDLVTRVTELLANAKPHMNTIEELKATEEAADESEGEIEVATSETSDEYNRKFYMESSEFLSEKVLKEIHGEAMRIMHKFKADKVKEYLSDKIIAECAAKALY